MVRSIFSLLSPSFSNMNFRHFRIGKMLPSSSSRPRPLKIILPTANHAYEIRKLFFKQKCSSCVPIPIAHLSISTDKTTLQKLQYKVKKIELQSRIDNGEMNLYIGERNGCCVILKRHTRSAVMDHGFSVKPDNVNPATISSLKSLQVVELTRSQLAGASLSHEANFSPQRLSFDNT